ncbi:PepSY domain-containing protein [Achromobacter xylosoxidans]|uniref:PepSY domain-containing protein n=1 Tax=Alcaligenes xylosoxydans xylosoxydans TaxID=85698 RepID=UPI000B48C55F|nr:PepSY domain-containing protein [Achromobacter xylosoxidans]
MTAIRNTLAALALGAATLAGAAAVHAQTAPAPAQPAATAPANATLTVRQIYDTLTAAGYRNITEIELEHGRYDVKADDAQGQRVKLRVDAQSGAVLRSRIKD